MTGTPIVNLKAPEAEKAAPQNAAELFDANQKLAFWMAHRFAARHPNLDPEDIRQEALLALHKASAAFNPEKGKFSSFAGAAIHNQLGKMSWARRIRGVPISRVDLDAPTGDTEGDEEDWHSKVATPDDDPATAADRKGRYAQMGAAVKGLDKVEKEALVRWINGEGYREIAKDLGVSFVYTGVIVRKALAKLKTRMQQESLQESRDDYAKLPLGKSARKYHNMSSKQAMTAGWKPQAYTDAAAEVTGQQDRKHGFANKSAGEETSGKAVPKTRPGESAVDQLVSKLLESVD
jgi:RNA polymerase sigma factor (sigma-70 family)